MLLVRAILTDGTVAMEMMVVAQAEAEELREQMLAFDLTA
jgi:hypothetical protein